MLLRKIAVSEVSETVAVGEIIEEYAGDKYGPTCLIFGRTTAGRPLHVHCTFPSRPVMKVITAYAPEASKWEEDFRKRRRHDL